MARSKDFKDLLITELKNPKKAIAYLNAVLEEYKEGDEESHTLLLAVRRDIAVAQGNLKQKKAGL